MKTEIRSQQPIIQLEGFSSWDKEGRLNHVNIYYTDIVENHLGKVWTALNPSNIGRNEQNMSATKVYEDIEGFAILIKSWGTTNQDNPQDWEEHNLIWIKRTN